MAEAPSPLPSWLVPWAVWVIKGKVTPRPLDAPKAIPDWALWFPAWCKWRMAGKPDGLRPANAPMPVPLWVWVPLRQIAKELYNVPPPPPPPPTGMAFWRRMSSWVTRIDHFPVDYLAQFHGTAYPYVVVPCAWGQRMERDNEAELFAWTDAAHRRGYQVVGSQWGAPEGPGDCEREAAYAVAMVRRFKFDGWVMNGEKRYEVPNWSKYYIRRFRADLPDLPFGWSPEVRLALDHDYFQANDVCYMPQVYPLEIPVATMAYAAEWAKNFGYLPENVVPLIGAYTVNDVRYPAGAYRAEALAAGFPAVCLYTANQSVDVPDYWRDLVL